MLYLKTQYTTFFAALIEESKVIFVYASTAKWLCLQKDTPNIKLTCGLCK